MKKLIKAAVRHAQSSYLRHPEYATSNYLHYSYVVERNQILGHGVNRGLAKTPLHLGYNSRLEETGYEGKEHSEYAAWRKCRDLIQNSFWVINLRLSRQGVIRFSQPCSCCTNFLSGVGCSKVVFSLDEGVRFATIRL